MKNIIYIFFALFIILTFISGCVNSSSSPTSAIGGGNAGTVTIFSPVTNDSIGFGITPINYTVKPVGGNQSVELYIDGIYNSTYFTTVSNSQPLTLIFDSSKVGTRFSYYLKYYDKNGSFSISDTMKNILVTLPRILPYTPTNITLLKLSPIKINISWADSSASILFYEVWKRDGFAGVWNNNFGSLPPATFNVNDNNLIPGVVYLYKVRSKNNFGYSQFSETVNTAGVGSSGSFAAPTNLVAVQVGSFPFSVKLHWEDNIPNENLFKIERNDNLSVFSEFYTIGAVANNSTSYVDNSFGLFAGRTYKYRVKAYSNTDSSWSNEASITLK
jgi:Fibronectin type III domain